MKPATANTPIAPSPYPHPREGEGGVRGRPVRSIGRDVMLGSRLALVADDQRLANAIQAHLKKSLGQVAFACTLDTVHAHLHRETAALLVLAAASRSESEKVLRLVQEIYIQKLPPIIMIVEETNLD